MVRVKVPNYEPIKGDLSGGSALLQAAATLDVVVYLAAEAKNVDKLMDAAAMWIGLAERLGISIDSDEDVAEDESDAPIKSFGFQSTSQIDEPTKEVIAEDV